MIKTLEWTKDGVRMLDQRLLPTEETYLMLRSYDEVAVRRRSWLYLRRDEPNTADRSESFLGH